MSAKAFVPEGALAHLSCGDTSSASQVCLRGIAPPSWKAGLVSCTRLLVLLSAAKSMAMMLAIDKQMPAISTENFSRRIQLIDKTSVVDFPQVMEIPRLHRTDVVHFGIFADVEIVNILDRGRQRVGFFR